jgi:hypothetical protein
MDRGFVPDHAAIDRVSQQAVEGTAIKLRSAHFAAIASRPLFGADLLFLQPVAQ